jgi:tetratricopeptide (TPR) repeat protein
MPLQHGQVRPIGPGQVECLHSWKEIASYLRHSIRSVQRWEQAEGLPVHRHPHEKRDSVYAYKAELDAWWKERKSRLEQDGGAPAAVTALLARTRWGGWLVGGALLGVGVLAGAVWFARWSDRAVPFAQRDWLLVADFDNQTGDAGLDRALATVFTIGLQQSTYANVLPRPGIERALRRMGRNRDARVDESVGREICLRDNVKALVACSVARIGRQYTVSARLVKPATSETLRAYQVQARTADELVGVVGTLTARMRRDLGESLASIRRSDRPLPQVTTPSLEALRRYEEGRELWRKGQYREAVRCYQAALEQDGEFAMAHAALGGAYLSHVLYEPEQGKRHYEKAIGNAGRITERERLSIEASYQTKMGHVEQAGRLLRVYLARYPDDSGAHFNYGALLMVNDRPEEAAEQYREVLRVAPNDASAILNLASCHRLLNRPGEALGEYARAFALEPAWVTNGNINHEYGFGFVHAGRIAEAREVFGRALAKPDMRPNGLRSLALLDMYLGKYREAQGRLEEAIRLTDAQDWLPKARNHLYLSMVREGRGDVAGRVAELDRAARLLAGEGAQAIWLLARVGTEYARAGAGRKAEGLRRRARLKLDPQDQKSVGEILRLEGELALSRGDFTSALALLREADGKAHSPLTLFSLARALDQAGCTAEAAAAYETMAAVAHLALGWEPQQSAIMAAVRLAEMHLVQGDKTKAAERIGRIRALWREADPDLALAKRIEGLGAR